MRLENRAFLRFIFPKVLTQKQSKIILRGRPILLLSRRKIKAINRSEFNGIKIRSFLYISIHQAFDGFFVLFGESLSMKCLFLTHVGIMLKKDLKKYCHKGKSAVIWNFALVMLKGGRTEV